MEPLQVLVGRWAIEASVDGQPVGGRVWTEFRWIDDGAFLIGRADAELDETTAPEWVANSPFPVTTIVGLDDTHGTYTQLYADGRGVHRVYQMALEAGVWTLSREAPGFNQRSTATFSPDGRTITGAWEMSTDGVTWSKDFDYVYTRLD